mgnify:FL=1|tara:strand:+ start:804 stop:950 length:147 start_codon:yes stop_codon:yes gene_type:complete
MDDAFLERYLRNNSPDVEFSEDELKDAIEALKKMEPEQLNYLTKNTPT